jgi:hypothetical protein
MKMHPRLGVTESGEHLVTTLYRSHRIFDPGMLAALWLGHDLV